jgi:hypothetical protein
MLNLCARSDLELARVDEPWSDAVVRHGIRQAGVMSEDLQFFQDVVAFFFSEFCTWDLGQIE